MLRTTTSRKTWSGREIASIYFHST